MQPVSTWIVLAVALPIVAAQPDDGWANLRKINWEITYAVMPLSGSCVHSSIISADDGQLMLAVSDNRNAVIQKADVLGVFDTPWGSVHDAIFSARSSWADVKAAGPQEKEFLRIVSRTGTEWQVTKPAVANDSVTFAGRTIRKADIQRVYYVRYVPLTPSESYVHHEQADFLAPRLWFHHALFPKINVLLYDAEKPEDNTPRGCPAP